MYHEVKECRAGGGKLIDVMSLGTQALTGIFPKPGDEVEFAPLDLVWCEQSGLLQLKHSCDPVKMYGMNYGYRSGLNKSMVQHLMSKARKLQKYIVGYDDIILDIGSNDGTFLDCFVGGLKIGIDPTGEKFQEYYQEGIVLIKDFFSQDNYYKVASKKAKLITSIAMFYDLADPIKFTKEVANCLDEEGIWHLEQSYLPSMLRQGCYDTICHEHLEYYSLTAIKRIIESAGLHIQSVTLNDVNGGSFALDVGHFPRDCPELIWLLQEEYRMGMFTRIQEFSSRTIKHRMSLTSLLSRLKTTGKTIVGYGASTKGNVVLQYCGIDKETLTCVAEVNANKEGCFTPGSNIPIVMENEARAMKPDYMLVLPWHFKAGIIERERVYLNNGGKLIFPFPYVEIVG